MKTFFITTLIALISSVSLAAGQFSQKDAKDVAVQYMRATPDYGIKAGDSIRLGKADSLELTREYMTQQISWIGPHNKATKKFQDFIAEMDRNPTLQVFYISLRTGSGDTLASTDFIVKLGLMNGKVTTEVVPYL